MNINDRMEEIEEKEELLKRIQHCQENSHELNGWEDDFLDSIEEQVEKGRKLSFKQMEKLEQIEYVVTEGRDDSFYDSF